MRFLYWLPTLWLVVLRDRGPVSLLGAVDAELHRRELMDLAVEEARTWWI